MEDPWVSPPEDVYTLTVPNASEPTEVVIAFERGVPVSVDGRRLPLQELIGEVGRIAGSYGFGRIDMVENRRVGIKSRETYECPGALALIAAHRDLEDLTLERDLHHEKARLEPRYAELVYDGLWFSPLKEALDAFVDASQEFVSGEVRLKLYKGNVIVVGRESPYSLYDQDLVTFEEGAVAYDHRDAAGFIRLNALRLRTLGQRRKKLGL
jgi:argininosuccinate synthase